MKTYQYFVANSWRDPDGENYFESENPATGKAWARLPDCNAVDVNRAVAAAKSAFYEGPWGKLHPAERGRVLRRIGDTISRHADRLGEVELRDNGRVPNAADSLKPGAWQVDSFHYYAGMCDKFEGRLIPAEVPNMHNYLTYEPFGVVAQILPWNSPLGTLIWKLAPCLAAGEEADPWQLGGKQQAERGRHRTEGAGDAEIGAGGAGRGTGSTSPHDETRGGGKEDAGASR